MKVIISARSLSAVSSARWGLNRSSQSDNGPAANSRIRFETRCAKVGWKLCGHRSLHRFRGGEVSRLRDVPARDGVRPWAVPDIVGEADEAPLVGDLLDAAKKTDGSRAPA